LVPLVVAAIAPITEANLTADFAGWEILRVDIRIGCVRGERLNKLTKVAPATFCPDIAMTLPAVSVPLTVPPLAGQNGVAATGLGFVELWQSHTIMPPGTCSFPKWMWACVTDELRFEKVSV
jgi:hypothetical protein